MDKETNLKIWIAVLAVALIAMIAISAYRIGTLKDRNADMREQGVKECIDNIRAGILQNGYMPIWWPGEVDVNGTMHPATYSMNLVPLNGTIGVKVNG